MVPVRRLLPPQVPVVDGYTFPHLVRRLNVAGRHVTGYLLELLRRRGYALNRSADFDTVRQAKERLCYVALDFQQEAKVWALPCLFGCLAGQLTLGTSCSLAGCMSMVWVRVGSQ